MTDPPTPESHAAQSPERVRLEWRDVGAVTAMLAMFVAAQLIAVLLAAPFQASGVKGFEDPEDPLNGVYLIAIILVFTAIILLIVRLKRDQWIQYIILGAVGLTLVYVFFPLFENYVPGFVDLAPAPRFYASLGVGAVLGALLTWLLYKFPEWYVVDTVGVLVAAGGIAIFGASFTPVTYLFVLAGTAIYDYISVYKTKHMLSLADSVLNYHLPIMLVVPKHLDYSFLEESTQLRAEADAPAPRPTEAAPAAPKRPRDAMFLGLGDIVIPSIFAFTALSLSAWAAVGSLFGTLAGFLVLMAFVLRGKPQAGLPALNTGSFLGFVLGFFLDKGTVVFWA